MNQLGTSEQVCSTVGASCDAGTTADAGCVIQRQFGGLVVHVQGVSVGRSARVDGHVATLLHDAVQCGAIHDHVFDHRVRCGAQRLDFQGVAVTVAHQTLVTGGLVFLWAVGASVDIEATGATDAFTAVGCEGEGFFASFD